jgi:carboxyl-terminal processing protease
MFSSPARSRRIWPFALIAVVAVVIGLWFGGHPSWLPSGLRSVFVSQTTEERQVQDVMNLLASRYYRPVNTQRLVNAGLTAAVASLHDPYSHYFPPEEYQSFMDVTNGQEAGIGVEIFPESAGLRIEEVFSGSPAARAGLVRGDLITRVGSTRVTASNEKRATALIRGTPGTDVTLTVLHRGHSRRVQITRANVAIPVAASAVMRFHGVRLGWLRFTSFTQGSAAALRAQVRRVLRHGARGLILDLRDNGGGLLNEAVNVASVFIPDGTIVSTDGRSQPRQVYTAKGGAIAGNIPMVVLVDRGTASAAEIVTGALKDRGRAKVVGTRTYGKGVFQEIQPLPNGGALDITVGEYFTPNGTNLGGGGVREGRGIQPNIYALDNPHTSKDEALQVAERTVAGEVR